MVILKKRLKLLVINYQGSEIKTFSLFELIFVILIIAIIIAFSIPKFNGVFNNSSLNKLKTEFSLIKQGIMQKKTKKILLGENGEILNLDQAAVNVSSEKLFTNVIDFSILSSKKVNSWIKKSNSSYIFTLNSVEKVKFILENSNFICKMPKTICKELE